MSYFENPAKDYDDVKKQCHRIDIQLQDRRNNQALQSGKAPSKPTVYQPAQFRDPNAMDIDATGFAPGSFDSCNSDEDKKRRHRELMKGRCRCCGAKSHTAEQGNHRDVSCRWCGKANHYERVCLSKVLGRPQIQDQQVRATQTPDLEAQLAAAKDQIEALKKLKDVFYEG